MDAQDFLEDLSFDTRQKPRKPHHKQGIGRFTAMIVAHIENLPNKPLGRKMDRLSLEERLRGPLPERGVDVGTVVRQLQQDVLSNIVHNDHPRCFSFIPGPSNFVSVMADALASGFNVIAADWLEASGPLEIELITVDWLRQLCGLPQTAGGLFVSGGSMANLISLRTARRAMLGENTAGAVIYCSDQTHYSVERAFQVLGFEPGQLRKLPSDNLFRLPVTCLKQEVTAAGFKLVGENDTLRNKSDPHTAKVFDPEIRGHTDQFMLKFKKP